MELTRANAFVGVRKSSVAFVTMMTPYMVDVVRDRQQFLLLFECVISLAADDITGSFERAIFLPQCFSTSYAKTLELGTASSFESEMRC